MPNKIAKFNIGTKFKKGKKILSVIGVFKDKENNIMYFLDGLKNEIEEKELMKLEKINPDDKATKPNKARS